MTISKLPQFDESDEGPKYEEGTVTVPFKGDDAQLYDKMKDYCYQYGPTQQEVIREALREFFKDKSINPRPEAIRNRTRVGRKRKNHF